MNKIQQKIKDKFVEVTKDGLTDKADYHAYEEVYPFLIDKFLGIRVNEQEEIVGLDISEHDMEAYAGFQIFTVE